MTALSWRQAMAWRMARHALVSPRPPGAELDTVRDLLGLHAQVAQSAVLTLAARVEGVRPDTVETLLWGDRSLYKSWSHRGTLHVQRSDEAPLYWSALDASVGAFYRRKSWSRYFGLQPGELEQIGEAVRAVLGSQPITRAELADAVCTHLGEPRLREAFTSGWGVLLKPSAVQGDLCFGPSIGQAVRFVSPRAWLPAASAAAPENALADLLVRFLRSYAPATPAEFARWLGWEAVPARRLAASTPGLATVDVEGEPRLALQEDVPGLAAAAPSGAVALLPLFDPFTIAGGAHADVFVPPGRKAAVFRPQGWISAVILRDGLVVGTWTHTKSRAGVRLEAVGFPESDPPSEAAIREAAQQLAGGLGSAPIVSFQLAAPAS